MSFEDIEAARTKRAKKEAVKEAKGKEKYSRKRKYTKLEEASVDKRKHDRKRKSATLELELELEPQQSPQ